MGAVNRLLMLAVALFVMALDMAAMAAEPMATTITVEKLCEGCAKQIAAKLKDIPGVGDVATQVPTKTITVTPKPGKVLVPRVMWETIEKGGERPTRLVGPSGTFTAKPKM